LSCLIPATAKVKDAATVVVRPEDIALRTAGSAETGQNLLEGKVVAAVFLGEAMQYELKLPGGTMLRLRLHASNTIARGDTVRIQIPANLCRALMA